MFYTKHISMLKYFALFSVIASLAACSDDDGGPVFDPDVPPQNVQVVAGDSNSTEVQNTISWTDDPAATDHVVYWNTTADVDENSGIIDVPDGRNYAVHTGIDVQPGVSYYYRVQAFSATESSVLSGVVTGTPQETLSGNDLGNNLNDVAWNGVDTLVAVGDSRVIISSTDGTADPWEDAVSAEVPSVSLSAVTWEGTTNDHFIIVGASGTVLTGTVSNWTLQPTPGDADLEDVKWIGDRYIAVGKEGTVITSDNVDGSEWSAQTLPPEVTNVTFKGVATNGNLIVAAGTNGTLLTSDDLGVSWTPWTVVENNHLNDVTWDGTQFIVVGSDDTIYISTDGAVWDKINPQTPDIAFVGVTQWDPYSPLPVDPMPAVVGSAGTFVVFPDETTRLNIETGTTEQLSANVWIDDDVNPAYFVMVGNDGFVLTSLVQ